MTCPTTCDVLKSECVVSRPAVIEKFLIAFGGVKIHSRSLVLAVEELLARLAVARCTDSSFQQR